MFLNASRVLGLRKSLLQVGDSVGGDTAWKNTKSIANCGTCGGSLLYSPSLCLVSVGSRRSVALKPVRQRK